MTRPLPIFSLFLLLRLMQGQALAQEKYLHIFVTNTNKSAVSGLSITCTRGCSTELITQGKAKIALPPQTRPNDIVTLRLIRRSPRNPEWIIVSPLDGIVVVPSFDGGTANAISILVARMGDHLILNDKIIKSIVEKVLKNAQMLDGQISGQQFNLALELQAKTFGLTPEEVVRAIRDWVSRAKDPYEKGIVALLDKKYSEATDLLTESYEMRKKRAMEFIDAAFFLGQSLHEQGKYREAVEKLQEVVLFRKDDEIVLNQLGLSLGYAGKYSEAELYYRRALAISEQKFGRRHPQTAIILNNLGLVCRLQHKYEEAEQLYNEALAINKKELGDEHPLTANSLNNLAQFFRDRGKYEEAEPLYKEALAIREKKLGKDHPDTAITIDNLGVLYNLQGRYEEAEPLLKYALDIKKKKLGYEHPLTGNSYNNLGNLYVNQGKYAEAIPLLEQALSIRKKDVGNENPIIGTSLNNIGVAYHRMGKYTEAEVFYKQSLDICAKTVLDDCAMTLRNLGKLYTTQGRYEEAEPLFQRSLAIFVKGLSEPKIRIVFVLESYAELLRKTKRENEADDMESLAKELRAKARFYGKN
jgi:Flp pilus assembly protein TadD, contains TPR repeats